MREVSVGRPSFPDVECELPLEIEEELRWQVICGDTGHWRAGVYSPPEASREDIGELERHDCPELFLLLSGRMRLVCFRDGGEEEIELRPMKPVLVRAPHSGYCPDGPHTGAAFVVERDAFTTEYRRPKEWGADRLLR